jgi:hypothetical protein
VGLSGRPKQTVELSHAATAQGRTISPQWHTTVFQTEIYTTEGMYIWRI